MKKYLQKIGKDAKEISFQNVNSKKKDQVLKSKSLAIRVKMISEIIFDHQKLQFLHLFQLNL